MDQTETVGKIISSSGKSEEEINSLIKEKMDKFSGLLTESGATLMVAKELGIELKLEEKKLERLQISQLRPGMNNVELIARVKHVFSPKQFEKNGRKGILCSLIVADKSGETRLTVWGKDVKKLEETHIQKGSALLLKNCYVGSYNNVPQLNLSYNGAFEVNPAEADALPGAEEKMLKLANLSNSETDASVIVRVLRIFPERNFDKGERKGKVANFMIGDGSKILRATAWNELVDELKKVKEGEAVKIEGAYTKEGMNGTELHLGFRARILQGVEAELPPATEMQGIEVKEKKISELDEKDRYIKLKAEIIEILPGNLRFNVCGKCGKKAEATEGKWLCNECGEIEPEIRPVISLRLKDETGEISAVFFAEQAEKVIAMTKEELKKRLEVNTADQLIAELRDKLAGTKVEVQGFPKMNSFSNELEFNARGFVPE